MVLNTSNGAKRLVKFFHVRESFVLLTLREEWRKRRETGRRALVVTIIVYRLVASYKYFKLVNFILNTV